MPELCSELWGMVLAYAVRRGDYSIFHFAWLHSGTYELSIPYMQLWGEDQRIYDEVQPQVELEEEEAYYAQLARPNASAESYELDDLPEDLFEGMDSD